MVLICVRGGACQLLFGEHAPVFPNETQCMPEDALPVTPQALNITHKLAHLVHGLQGLERQGRAVQVPHLGLWEDSTFGQVVIEEWRAGQRDGKGNVTGECDVRCARDEFEFPAKSGEWTGTDVEHETIEKDDAGVQALADQLDLRKAGILDFVHFPKPVGVKGFHPTE